MNRCQRCNGGHFVQVDNTTVVCTTCGANYKINTGQVNLIDLTKCEDCSSWYFKELEKVCDCKKIGDKNE
jgi:hypothetical protein